MKFIIAALIMLALQGCMRDTSNVSEAGKVSGIGGNANIKEVTLSDGTKCAVLIGYRKGGIDCGW